MMTDSRIIPWKRIAVEWVSGNPLDDEAYVCRRTGKIYWISGEPGVLEEKIENPDDIDDVEKYVPVPGKLD